MAENHPTIKPSARRIHGMSKTPEHKVWRAVIDRCTNPKSSSYQRYGGKGIEVCDRWRTSFSAFFADMGPRPTPKHSIERENNAGHYEQSNCHWATAVEQGRNKSTNHVVECDGVSMPVTAWADRLQVSPYLIFWRLRHGWSVRDALYAPKGSGDHTPDSQRGKRRRTA